MAELVELGSGVPTKTLLLLDAMRDAGTLDRYVPFDVSEVVLRESAEMLVERYPGIARLRRRGRLRAPPRRAPARRGPARDRLPGRHDRQLPARLAAASFLRSLGQRAAPAGPAAARHRPGQGPGGARGRLQRRAGVTAAFNRNMLAVLNRELDADFDLDAFEHVAFYDREQEWIEMRLRALRSLDVHVAQARPRRALRQPRGAAHRDQREVHPRAAGGRPRRRRACGCTSS